MKYPKEYLEEIKTRLKVSTVVSKTVNLKKRGKEYVGLSPFKTEKTPSFTVNDEKEFYHCFSTAEHGNIFDFVMKTQNLKFGEAVRFLSNLAGMQPYTFSKQDEEREKKWKEYQSIFSQYVDFYHSELLKNESYSNARDYLKNRSLTKEEVKKFKIGYISEDRKKEGLILMHDVLSNAGITVWSNLKKILSFLNDQIVYNKVDPYVKQLEVKTPSYQQIVSNLSGGNQQKISVAKWLASGTDILFIDEPTVGIDIKTKSYLHELIIDLSLKGTSIILITSDMPEMISLADRIITMKDFKVVGETINNHNYEQMSSSIMGNIHE